MFANPENHVHRLHLREGMSVADIGCGTGAYTILLSQAVGSSGKVYAVDVQEPLIQSLASRSRESRHSNIRVLRANVEHIGGTHLAEGTIQAVVIANTLFQVEDKKGFVGEIRRILSSGGRVLIVDWKASYGGIGPAIDAVFSEKDTLRLFLDARFSVEESFDAGDHHYGFIFYKC